MEGIFRISGFSSKKQRALKACHRCRKLHKKCEYNDQDDLICILCRKTNATCNRLSTETLSQPLMETNYTIPGNGIAKLKTRRPITKPEPSKRQHVLLNPAPTNTTPATTRSANTKNNTVKLERKQDSKTMDSIFENDRMYANIIESGEIKSQFITATQPLAPLLSRDSFLTLSDGDFYNFYFPWREVFLPSKEQREEEVDKELLEYLNLKGAFDKPPEEDQKRLLNLYLENCYPILPVVDKTIVDSISEIPPILLNALMLTAIRYDPMAKGEQVRVKAETFRKKCKLLELIERNKITLIQTFLLLSAHEESPQGAQQSRGYLIKATTLIEELALHNFGAKNQISTPSNSGGNWNGGERVTGNHSSYPFKLSYKKSLLTRLFWTSYCCDRMTTVTGCSALHYNKLDLIIDEPTLEDFEGDRREFEIFKRWYSNCELLERIIVVAYRPPGNRSVDYTLERDILKLHSINSSHEISELIGEKFARFITVCISFSAIVYLRSKVDFISLLDDDIADPDTLVESNYPLTDNKMYYLSKFYKEILNNAREPKIEHVVVIHAILHVMVLLHLEIKARQEVLLMQDQQATNSLSVKRGMYDQCMKYLEINSSKWFFSAAAFYMCRELLSKKKKPNESSTDLLSLIYD